MLKSTGLRRLSSVVKDSTISEVCMFGVRELPRAKNKAFFAICNYFEPQASLDNNYGGGLEGIFLKGAAGPKFRRHLK